MYRSTSANVYTRPDTIRRRNNNNITSLAIFSKSTTPSSPPGFAVCACVYRRRVCAYARKGDGKKAYSLYIRSSGDVVYLPSLRPPPGPDG